MPSKRYITCVFTASLFILGVLSTNSFAAGGTYKDADAHTFKAGDKIQINVENEAELTNTYTINDDGHLDLPLIGDIDVQGQTGQAIEAQLTEKYQDGYLVNPEISVLYFAKPKAVKKVIAKKKVIKPAAPTSHAIPKEPLPKDTIYIIGAVKTPGAYPFTDEQSHLLQAVALAGGYKDGADKSKFEIIRKTDNVYYRGFQDSGTYGLKSGDIIIIQER